MAVLPLLSVAPKDSWRATRPCTAGSVAGLLQPAGAASLLLVAAPLTGAAGGASLLVPWPRGCCCKGLPRGAACGDGACAHRASVRLPGGSPAAAVTCSMGPLCCARMMLQGGGYKASRPCMAGSPAAPLAGLTAAASGSAATGGLVVTAWSGADAMACCTGLTDCSASDAAAAGAAEGTQGAAAGLPGAVMTARAAVLVCGWSPRAGMAGEPGTLAAAVGLAGATPVAWFACSGADAGAAGLPLASTCTCTCTGLGTATPAAGCTACLGRSARAIAPAPM